MVHNPTLCALARYCTPLPKRRSSHCLAEHGQLLPMEPVQELQFSLCRLGASLANCRGLPRYASDESNVSFPWSMIDKITPAADPKVGQMLLDRGYQDVEIRTYEGRKLQPSFVNAEETEYLVIEDNFPNGRPAWEKGGVYFTDRETVDKVETMKVTTCLNPLHTALAIYGCLRLRPHFSRDKGRGSTALD